MPIGIKGFQKEHKGYRYKKVIERLCLFCGKTIYVPPCLIKIGSGKFCDIKCYSKWQSENRNLEKSILWKGGSEASFRHDARKKVLKYGYKMICGNCGRTKSIIVHHIDQNIKNNDINNLIVLCQSCHVNLHNKLSHKRKVDRAKHFVCEICGKDFYVNTKSKRKVCSSECSYEYSKKHGLWFCGKNKKGVKL